MDLLTLCFRMAPLFISKCTMRRLPFLIATDKAVSVNTLGSVVGCHGHHMQCQHPRTQPGTVAQSTSDNGGIALAETQRTYVSASRSAPCSQR